MTIQYIIQGEMDARGMRERQEDWSRLAVANDHVQLNLVNVTKIDPSGLGAILFLFKRLTAARKRFEIINATGQPARYLAQFQLDEILGPKETLAARRPSFMLRPRLLQVARIVANSRA